MRFVVSFPTCFVREADNMADAVGTVLSALLAGKVPIAVKDETGAYWRVDDAIDAFSGTEQDDAARFDELRKAMETDVATLCIFGEEATMDLDERAFTSTSGSRMVAPGAMFLDPVWGNDEVRVYVRSAHPLIHDLQHAVPPPFKVAGLTSAAATLYYAGRLAFVFPDGAERRHQSKDEEAS